MRQALTVEQTRQMMEYVSSKIIALEEELNQADRLIGDGDHGAAMARGFESLFRKLKTEQFADIGVLFVFCGNTLLASVGGSAGIIFGTLFRSGGKALIEKKTFGSTELGDFLDQAVKAIMARGGAKPGDKTMLDALHPAAKAAMKAARKPLSVALREASEAAIQGMENTRMMVASLGRAKVFGEKSQGQLDPGAITACRIIKSMDEFVQGLGQ